MNVERVHAVCFLHTLNADVSSLQVVVNLGLVYKVQHHSGVIFQFVAFIRKRKRTVPDIVAAGGRYDHLVGFTRSSTLHMSKSAAII